MYLVVDTVLALLGIVVMIFGVMIFVEVTALGGTYHNIWGSNVMVSVSLI